MTYYSVNHFLALETPLFFRSEKARKPQTQTQNPKRPRDKEEAGKKDVRRRTLRCFRFKFFLLVFFSPLETRNMSVFREIAEELRGMSIRTFLSQVLGLGLIVTSAFMIWKSLILATGSESPVSWRTLSSGGFYTKLSFPFFPLSFPFLASR